MEDKQVLKAIEELNLEIINLRDSKEYSTGRELNKTKSLLKKMKFITIIKKIIKRNKRKKVNRYIDHEERDNSYIFEKNSDEIPKIVVYTCITGGYDNLISPIIKPDNIDYIAFTDNKKEDNKNWIIKDIPENIKTINNNMLINRYVKFHPYELFKDKGYDYAIYIDGSIMPVSDFTDLVYAANDKTGLAMHRHYLRNNISKEIEVCKILKKGNYEKLKEQVKRYEKEGFPQDFGMLECAVIVSKLNNQTGEKILKDWWRELKSSESYRDQISIPYVLWKENLKIDDIGNLGYNIRKNPKFRIILHENEK